MHLRQKRLLILIFQFYFIPYVYVTRDILNESPRQYGNATRLVYDITKLFQDNINNILEDNFNMVFISPTGIKYYKILCHMFL